MRRTRRASLTDASGNRAELRYDGHDRQNRWVFPSKTTRGAVNESDYESYAYDEAGNRAALRKRGDLRRRTWIIGVALMLESELAQR